MLSNSRDSLPTQANITVTVRVRPLSAKEISRLPLEPLPTSFPTIFQPGNSRSSIASVQSYSGNGSQPSIRRIVSVVDEQVLVFDPPDKSAAQTAFHVPGAKRYKNIFYTFDRVFDENASQQEVYENSTKHLIDGVLNGYNATVFAYGATGCGKTHTITGTQHDPGVIFRTMRDLFQCIRDSRHERITEVSVSYLEVYNETIRDLLCPDSGTPLGLELREDDNSVQVTGLSHHNPRDVEHIMQILLAGNNNRTKAFTEANEASSRSHAVLQIHVKTKERTAGVHSAWNPAVLSIIDLAGSERASVTKNQGERLHEGAKINRSLLALGNCINALCNPATSSHVPYRDSKLTRLLKYSLGGNCRVVMIAAVSPASFHYEETHNTLQYANRAKNIRTKVQKNVIDVHAHVGQFGKIIEELRAQVSDLQSQLRAANATNAANASKPTVGTDQEADLVKVRKQKAAEARAAKAIDRARNLYTELRAHRAAVHRHDLRKLCLEHRLAAVQSLLEVVWGDEGDVPELAPVRDIAVLVVGSIEDRLKETVDARDARSRAAIRVEGSLDRLNRHLPTEGPRMLEVDLMRTEFERDDHKGRYESLEVFTGEIADGASSRDLVTSLVRIVGMVSRAKTGGDGLRLDEAVDEATRVLGELARYGGHPATSAGSGDDVGSVFGGEDRDAEPTDSELEEESLETSRRGERTVDRIDEDDFSKATEIALHKLDFGKFLSAARLPPVHASANHSPHLHSRSRIPAALANAGSPGTAKKRRKLENGDDSPVRILGTVDAMDVESTPKHKGSDHPHDYITFPADELDGEQSAATPRPKPRNERLRSELVMRLDSPRRRADRVAAASAGAIGLTLSPRPPEPRSEVPSIVPQLGSGSGSGSPPGQSKTKRRSMIPVSVSRRALAIESTQQTPPTGMEVDIVPTPPVAEKAPKSHTTTTKKRIGRPSIAPPTAVRSPEPTRVTRSKAVRKSIAYLSGRFRRKRQEAEGVKALDLGPKIDFSLKEGQTININIGGKKATSMGSLEKSEQRMCIHVTILLKI
ncbi:kinesin-like protein Klp5 [Gonapodya sp. JEL0774]|nr:kinesin-like protein Klp5 [Gonapodya sp. JEL0774]